MIKINLVAEGRKPVVARRAKEALGAGATLGEWLLFATLAVCLLVTGGIWWKLHSVQKQKAEDIRQAQQVVAELEPIIKEVEEYKKKKAALEHKIAVINDLKRNQRGPVRIMDQISRALPELLWLDSLTMKGSSIELRGRAFNTNQVAAFLENLNEVPEFQEPILKEAIKQAAVYRFSISFNFSLTTPERARAAQAAEAGG